MVTLCRGWVWVEADVDQGVAGFVPGGAFLVFLGHGHAAAFAAHADLDAGFLQFDHADGFFAHARGQQGGFVQKVGQIGAGIAGGAAGDDFQIDRGVQLHVAGVDFQNGFAPAHVGQADHDLAVKTARPQQGRVEHVGAIGGGDDDDAVLGVESVHLDQQGVQSLLAFVVAAAPAVPAAAAHGVNFVDENQAGRVFAGLLEHVAHAAGADADKHFHKIRAADAEERGVGLARDGLGQQGLARARRAHHQDALGNAAAEFLKFFRVLEEFDQFGNLLLGFLDAGDVLEGDLVFFLVQHAGAAFAKAHGAFAGHFDLAEDEKVDGGEDEDEGQTGVQEHGQHEIAVVGRFETLGRKPGPWSFHRSGEYPV